MKKTLIGTLLIATLSIMLMGCGNNNPPASSSAPAPSEPTQVSQSEPQEPLMVVNTDLGFEVELPELLRGKMGQETTTYESYGETVVTVTITYQGEENKVNVMSFEEMSKEVWDKMKAEGGPVGVELGVSKDNRVVVFNTLQSNPFAEGSKDYSILNDLPRQLKVVEESFKFID